MKRAADEIYQRSAREKQKIKFVWLWLELIF